MRFLFVLLLIGFGRSGHGNETNFPSWAFGVRGAWVPAKVDLSWSASFARNIRTDLDVINVAVFAQKEFYSNQPYSGTLLLFGGGNLGDNTDVGSVSTRGYRVGGELTGNINFQLKSLRIQPLLGFGVSFGLDQFTVDTSPKTDEQEREFSNTQVQIITGCRFLDRFENLMSSLQLGYRVIHSGQVRVDGLQDEIESSGFDYGALSLSLHLGYLF